MDENPKRISWRNVFLLCVLQSPIWCLIYFALPDPANGPRIESPEGRAIIRDAMRTFFPEIAAHKRPGE